jgi:hypothetical protein
MVEMYLRSLIPLYGVEFNSLSTWIILPLPYILMPVLNGFSKRLSSIELVN